MAFEGNTWITYIIFALIVTIALLGNACVIYVLVSRPCYLKRSYNILIFSLAVTDIVTAIFLIFSRFLYLPPSPSNYFLREVYCRAIWSAAIVFGLAYVSIYTCLALTFDRWLAVVKPYSYKMIKARHVVRLVVAVWIVGILANAGVFFRVKFDEDEQRCTWTKLRVGDKELPWFDFAIQTIFPISTMVVLYAHILYTLKKLPSMQATVLKKVLLVALAASCATVIGWLPNRITFMLSKFGKVDPNGFFQFCLVLMGFFNSCINPFLYGIYSSQFQREYISIFRKLFGFSSMKPIPESRATRMATVS